VAQRVEGMLYDLTYTRQVTENLQAVRTFDALKRQLVYAARLKREIDRSAQYACLPPNPARPVHSQRERERERRVPCTARVPHTHTHRQTDRPRTDIM
jgi:hypothetical protein